MPIRNVDPFNDIFAHLDASKNPYVEKILHATSSGSLPIYWGPRLRDCAGQWRDKLASAANSTSSTSAKLFLEIGCHTGRTLMELARRTPQDFFVGMDITFKRVYCAAEKAQKTNLKNVACVLANAGGVTQLFAPGELDGVVIFFPDPWLKLRQAHNRLLSPEFLQQLHSLLKPGGWLWLRTDQKFYFVDTATHLEGGGWQACTAMPFHDEGPITSTFQEHFARVGTGYHEGKWLKMEHQKH